MKSFAPVVASSRTVASPMPLDAPVMSTTFSLSPVMVEFLLFG